MAEKNREDAGVFAPNTREQAIARSRSQALDYFETVICFTCGDRPGCHYDDDSGSGCVGESPRVATLDPMISNVPVAPMIAGGPGCACPGYLQGQLPHAIIKHLDGLAYEGEEIDCVSCGHGLDRHDEHYGCWSCPCEVNEHPEE